MSFHLRYEELNRNIEFQTHQPLVIDKLTNRQISKLANRQFGKLANCLIKKGLQDSDKPYNPLFV